MGDFLPTYSTDHIWRDENMEMCLSENLSDIESSIASLETGKANSEHTHDMYATETYVENKLSELVASSPSTLQTLNELAAALGDDPNFSTTIATQLGNKADINHTHNIATQDSEGFMSTADRIKLDSIESGANKIVVDDQLSSSSTNPVQNNIIQSALDQKSDIGHMHNVFNSLTEIGITTFPTTMQLVSEAMPKNSMIVVDNRRINGVESDYNTETISDWANESNGVAIIVKGVSTARIGMMILYGTTQTSIANILYGSYAHDANRVNWESLRDNLDGKVDKLATLSAIDLNTVTETGLYYVDDGTSELHYPSGSNGHMIVMSDGTRVRQVYFRVGTIDSNNFQWYSRSLGSDRTVGVESNGWSQWWMMSGSEQVWDGSASLNAEIPLGSRYGCQAWVIVGQVTSTDTYSTVYIPRQFLTTNTTKNRFQIADETGYVSFYFYYKASDNNVYAKVSSVSDTTHSVLKYVFRVS